MIYDWPRMMSRQSAAKYLDMTTSEFDNAIAAGKLPEGTTYFGGKPRWNRAALDEAIEQATGRGPAPWKGKRKFDALPRTA